MVFLITINCEEIRKFPSHVNQCNLINNVLLAADFLKVCKKSDPKINECVYNSVNNLKPYLVTGIPSLDIPSLEPIDLGDLIVAGRY